MAYHTIKKRISELLDSASNYYNMPFAPPRVLVDLTGADAGQAIYDDNLLRFNMSFCCHNHDHFVHNIVAHEMAHLVAPHVYGKRIAAHGREWKKVMTEVFRVSPESHHSYDLRQSGRYRFIYGCRCVKKETPLSAIRHNRWLKGVIYFCETCGGRLQFLYEEPGNNGTKKYGTKKYGTKKSCSINHSGRYPVPLSHQKRRPQSE